ncbi:MAG TPA: hypothetical protein VN577_08150 [Terriglobales bacterium]|nr:hypothetical protein [Terriglobales bacterium]
MSTFKRSVMNNSFVALLRECWRRMAIMKAASDRAEHSDGSRFGERRAERRRDEEAWLRMDDEGCPNVRQSSLPQDIVEMEAEGSLSL